MYTTDWELRKLGELTIRITRKNKKLESTLPLTISAQNGLVDQETFFNKKVASHDVSGYYLLKNGDFAYNKSYSKGYPWGTIKRLNKYDMGVLSTLYIVFKPIHVNSNFLASYYDSSYWYREVSINAAEGARNHGLLNISTSDFFNTELSIPRNNSEQIKISDFLLKIKKLVALQQREITFLKDGKKSLMNKLFPLDGNMAPLVTYTTSNGDWEQRKLGDITTERNERSKNGELLSVTINSGINKTVSLKRKNSASDDKSNYKRVYIGDIAYNSMRMWQGASGVSKYNGIVSPAYTVLYVNKNFLSNDFLGCIIKLHNMTWKFRTHSQGLTSDTWNLKYPLFSQIDIKYPSLYEQIQIEQYLEAFDNLIHSEEQKLNRLSELKKFFLQKLFI
ncbi:restriction endonuclease subunit S [Companilactobacillus jidongensis]|uniref:restriction endonuclease subunit S n=1 Tax=Companilactobacillus jidongensis TaxID=2486006 RepID=UPI000F7964AD|nr:restriction endonuclease subunit S [Companilactobacillus jidongensis]